MAVRHVVCIEKYSDGDVVDFVEVPWHSPRSMLGYCRECNLGDCPRWASDHRESTGHKPVYHVAVEPHQHSTWCTPICGEHRIVRARRPRKAVPVQTTAYTGPLTCFFGQAHWPPEATGRCVNCRQILIPSGVPNAEP